MLDKIILQDNWKKERKMWIYLMIFILIGGVTLAISFWYNPIGEDPIKSILPIIIFFGGLFLLTLYGVIYCSLYTLLVTDDKIIRKSMFGKVEILRVDIKGFTFKKYNQKSELYQFVINANGKNVKIYTRYYNEFKEFLDLTARAQ